MFQLPELARLTLIPEEQGKHTNSFADKSGRVVMVRRRIVTARVGLDGDTDTSTTAGSLSLQPGWRLQSIDRL